MVTIREVANVAGVSIGTVSNVITSSVPVSNRLRRKVQAAIRQLNYHPNHIARSLKTHSTRTLGIVVPGMTVPHFSELVRGADAAAHAKGYSLIAVNSQDDGDRQRELLSMLRSQRVEGVLLVSAAGPAAANQIVRMAKAGLRLVCVDRVPDRVGVDNISVENIEAAKLGTDHLIEQGYRRIAVFTGPQTLKNERQRLRGYKLALDKAGLAIDQDLVWFGSFRPEDVAEMCRGRLGRGIPKPDAIFCTNGLVGLGVLRALRDYGLRIPDDMGSSKPFGCMPASRLAILPGGIRLLLAQCLYWINPRCALRGNPAGHERNSE